MLGTDLIRELVCSHQILGAGRNPAVHLQTPYFLCDFSDPASVVALLKTEKPDIVFHAAAMTQVDDCEKLPEQALLHNTTAVKNISDACSEINAKLVFFSTDYVFNGQKRSPYLPDDARDPVSVYGKSKANAEEYLERNNNNFIIFRLSWLYGLSGRSFPKTILKLAKTNPSLSIVSDQTGAPTWTKDIAKWLRISLEKSKNNWMIQGQRIYHLANSGACTWADFARFILQTAEIKNICVKDISSSELGRPATRPQNSIFDLLQTHNAWGFSLRDWKEAYQEFYQELRKSES